MPKKMFGFLISLLFITIILSQSGSCSPIENEQTYRTQPDYRGFMIIIGTYDFVDRSPFEIRGGNFAVLGFVYEYYDGIWTIISGGGSTSGGLRASSFIGFCRAGFICGIIFGDITELLPQSY